MRDLILVLVAALLLRAFAQQIGDEDASAPAPGAAAREADAAAGATPDREQWRREDRQGAPSLSFRSADLTPIAGIACENGSDRLRIERVATAHSGGIGTMTLSADNRIRSLAASWTHSEAPVATAYLKLHDRMVDSLARGSGRIELALSGEPTSR